MKLAATSGPVIFIDPGHGGTDGGAPSIRVGRSEKEVNLAVSLALARKLRRAGVEVALSRCDDRTVTLHERRARIIATKANLVISVHADAGPPAARGASVYVLDDRGRTIVVDRLSRTRPTRESDIDHLLADLAQRGAMNEAVRLAVEIRARLATEGFGMSRGVRAANLALLKSPGVPSVLVELGYVTNVEDAAGLFSTARQERLADAIAAAIVATQHAAGRYLTRY